MLRKKWLLLVLCSLASLLLPLQPIFATSISAIEQAAQQDVSENQKQGYRLPATAAAADKLAYQQAFAQCYQGYQTAAAALLEKRALPEIAADATVHYRAGYQAAHQQFITAVKAGKQAGYAGEAATPPAAPELATIGYQRGYATGQARRQTAKPAVASSQKIAVATQKAAPPKAPPAAKKVPPQPRSAQAMQRQSVRKSTVKKSAVKTPAATSPNALPAVPAPPAWLLMPGQPLPQQQTFIQQLAKSAVKIAPRYGLYASVMIAQAALESDWGRSDLARPPYHNLFGVKGAYTGQTAVWWTQEDAGQAQFITQSAAFKRYPSYQQALLDYARLLKNGLTLAPDFYAGAWRQNAATYRLATQFLTGRYATDRYYHLKLNQIIQTYQLTQYDQPQQSVKAVNFTAKLKQQPPVLLTWAAYFKPSVPVVQLGEILPLRLGQL